MPVTDRDEDVPLRLNTFTVPIIIPIIFMLWCLFLGVAPQNPQIELLYAAMFLVSGVIVYFPLIHFNLKPKWLERFEMYVQLLLEVAPSTYAESF